MDGRTETNMILVSAAGAVFAGQIGTIFSVFGCLTSRKSRTTYGSRTTHRRNIKDFWHVETSANLWFSDRNSYLSGSV